MCPHIRNFCRSEDALRAAGGDPVVVTFQARPLARLRAEQTFAEDMARKGMRALAIMALLLTVAGLLSVLAYTVQCRTAEFGIRLALGATPQDLRTMVLRRGMLLAATGVVVGIAGALALTRFIQALLFETRSNDPWVFAAVTAILLTAAFVACVVPASRAARVDVTRLLRSE